MSETLYLVLLWGLLASAPVVLILLLRVSAPYGRHHRPGWGPALPSRWAWLMMELPALLVMPLLFLIERPPGGWWSWMLLFWLWHYAYRALVFPLLLKKPRANFPLSVALMAVLFNLVNGYLNGYALFVLKSGWGGWNGWAAAGALLFVAGWVLHVHSDHVLRHLRRPDGPRYAIPERGLFRWVSSPHYLGEIIQWLGWALLTGTLAGLVFAIFTIANLLPRAVANQRWYLAQFPDYPAERKILLPKLF